MTDYLGKQGGRGAGIWALKQQLFALVCCCVPLVLFWIARLVSVPFSLFCHRFLPALLQPGLLYPTTCSSSPGQKGKVSKVARSTSSILWAVSFLPCCWNQTSFLSIWASQRHDLSWELQLKKRRVPCSVAQRLWRERGREAQGHIHRTHFHLPSPCPQTSPNWKCWSILGEGCWAVPPQLLLFSLLPFRPHLCIREGLVGWLI